jgi:hypothetical protein
MISQAFNNWLPASGLQHHQQQLKSQGLKLLRPEPCNGSSV